LRRRHHHCRDRGTAGKPIADRAGAAPQGFLEHDPERPRSRKPDTGFRSQQACLASAGGRARDRFQFTNPVNVTKTSFPRLAERVRA